MAIPLQVTGQGDGETVSTKRGHMRRLSSSGCAMLDSLLADICNTLVVSSVEQVRNIKLSLIYVSSFFLFLLNIISYCLSFSLQKEPSDPRLKGIVTANQDDMKQLNWFSKLSSAAFTDPLSSLSLPLSL